MLQGTLPHPTPRTGWPLPLRSMLNPKSPENSRDAQVAVPEGGIGGIQVGLRGASDGSASDVLFPLENDPFAAAAGGVDRPLSMWLTLAGALALLGVLGAVVWQARRRAAASYPPRSRKAGWLADLRRPVKRQWVRRSG